MKLGHQEIFERMRRDILAGKFDGESKLPSEMALARRFDVSRPTMSRVMRDLKREGLIMTRKGAPTMLTRYARNATGSLGIVVPGECYAEIFAPIVKELKRVAERNGWRVLTESIKSDKPTVRAREARRIAYLYAKERVAGVFFQPMEFVKDYTSASRALMMSPLPRKSGSRPAASRSGTSRTSPSRRFFSASSRRVFRRARSSCLPR